MTTIWSEQALTPKGWQKDVAISVDEHGRIASVQANQPRSGEVVDILLPSPANVHSHAFQRAMAGLTERRGPDARDSFWTWRRLMFRFLDQLTPGHIQAISAYVQMEMLEAGYATNGEFHYLHHQPSGVVYDNLAEMSERIAEAASETGIGLTLLPVHYQYGGCDRRDLGPGQRRFGNDTDRFRRLHEAARSALKHLPPDARIGAAPHSLRAVSREGLASTVSLVEDGPVHMHLAEQVAEVDEVEAAWGQRPVEWLLDHVDIDDRWCLIHCTQMLEHETLSLGKTDAVAGLCPITESNLGDGIFDGVRFLGAGGKIAVGSDSNIRISLSEELRTLDYSQRLRDRSRAALATAELSTGRRLFQEIVTGGAQATGRGDGGLVENSWADLVALDADAADLQGREGDEVLDAFIFAGDDRMVSDVWSAGRHLVQNKRHIKHDQIRASYISTMKQLSKVI